MTSEIKGTPLVRGNAQGELVVSWEPFSFFGGFDFQKGTVVDPWSDKYGENLKGKIFAYPRGKGSSSTAGVILEALRGKTAPAAIINIECEKILAVGAIVGEIFFNFRIPIVSVTEADFNLLSTGAVVRIFDSGRIVVGYGEKG